MSALGGWTGQGTAGIDPLERLEFFRLDANRRLKTDRRAEWGQFLTPAPVARLLASHIAGGQDEIRVLDAGAGVGTLFSSVVAELCDRDAKPRRIHVTAYEIDPELTAYLPDTLALCRGYCEGAGVYFTAEVVEGDFLRVTAAQVADGLFGSPAPPYTVAILNPPYGKITADSEARRLLGVMGIETSNLYTGFLAAAVRLLERGGELVAITPRSFCNGSYFRTFRKAFLAEMELRTLHVFESRCRAFREDAVLQENVIIHAVKGRAEKRAGRVTVVSGVGPEDALPLAREAEYDEVVRPDDPQAYIRIAPDSVGEEVFGALAGFKDTLAGLGLSVSTGRVVDFRVKEYLRHEPGEEGTAALIWPTHFDHGYVAWPKPGAKKPQAICAEEAVRDLLVPNEHYVLVRRFSAKEERRRVVAAVCDAGRLPGNAIGFENHLNYYHRNGGGIDLPLARGLAVFLNSTLVDASFRQFSGHTQVNATDLRSLGYPTADQLRRWGAAVGDVFPDQVTVDELLAGELNVPKDARKIDPVKAKQKADAALGILRALGFPRQQVNERSALTLLALLGLKPGTPWAEASDPLCGITPMMDFFRDYYGKSYKPNTRETVRRQTVHQFLEAGLIVANPDEPGRAVNSPKAVYRIETSALKLLRGFGGETWDKDLSTYLSTVETLKQKYSQQRDLARLPVTLAPGKELSLSPGGQNVLVKEIIDQFVPRFTSPGKFVYVGDTDEKFAYFDESALSELGVTVDEHGKMPDVIVHYTEKNWLVLIEAVTSHGPINPKRKGELSRRFKGSKAGLVFVTAFLTRRAMVAYLDEISWETEVWVAESPTHMVHFNGKRFLGPYPE